MFMICYKLKEEIRKKYKIRKELETDFSKTFKYIRSLHMVCCVVAICVYRLSLVIKVVKHPLVVLSFMNQQTVSNICYA